MKKVIGLLVFTLLILIKVSGFHVYAHDDDDCESVENCETCDLVMELQNSDLDFPSPITFDLAKETVEDKLVSQHKRIFTDKKKAYRLHSRPPPCS